MQNLILISTVIGSTLAGVALGTAATRLLLSVTARMVAAGRAGAPRRTSSAS